MNTTNKNLHKNQSGLVSFLVVTIIMLVLTLIVLAFARVVRREQVQTLDRQLNAQAFYAAESGVNDALAALAANPALAGGTYNDCDDFITAPNPDLNNDLGNGVSYSCLLVDASPSELLFPNVNAQQSTATEIRPAGSSPVTSLQLSWEGAGTNISGCPNPGTFPSNWSASCQIGMLRFEFVPFNGPTGRSALITNRAIGFLSPRTTGYTTELPLSSLSGDNQGRVMGGDCRNAGPGPRRCTFTITGLNVTRGYLRLRSIYGDTPVTVRAFNGTTQLDLIGSQVEIDVTGRSNSVLKRLKVNAQIPTAGEGDQAAEFALQTTKTQCKRFDLRPGAATPSLGGITGLGPNDPDYCNPLTP